MDDFATRFKASVDLNVRDVFATPLPENAYREVWLKRALIVSASTLIIGLVAVGGAALAIHAMKDSNRLPATGESPSTASRTPTGEQSARRLDWPSPFVPAVRTEGNRSRMTVVFPDGTVARLSYPAQLRLAEMGVQPTVSYSLQNGRRNAPHDIIFIHGRAPHGLLNPEPIETFAGSGALHEVTYRRVRGEPPFAVVYEKTGWTIVATLQSREDAPNVAENLHPSVTDDGWPSVSATGPVELSDGFGEARGPHLEIGDRHPLFDFVDAGEEFAYIIMGLVAGCEDVEEDVSEVGRDWYGSRCLQFEGGELGIFVSIDGPEQFVRAVFRGIELDEES